VRLRGRKTADDELQRSGDAKQVEGKRPAFLRGCHDALVLLVVALLFAGCGSRDRADEADTARAQLDEVTLPELARVDAPVQAQIRDRYAAVTKMAASGTAPARELGNAFGEYGMLLHAAEYHDAAKPAYLNAQTLVPDDYRWPYYLAQLYRTVGDTQAAMAAFGRVLELRPDDVTSLVWLGRMHLAQGEPERAEPVFARARSAAPGVVAAQVGLGQVALAKKDYSAAVEWLEGALATDPSAASVYSPLAMAYRGLGQMEKAESLATQWRNTELAVPDPLRQELDMTVQSGLSFELRGVRALESRDFTAAADLFRQGLALAAPGSTLRRSLRHKLGTALALSGDTAGAAREFEETVRLAPKDGLDEPAAKASYSLGILHAGSGRHTEAAHHLTTALRYNPNYFEARVALADVLRSGGRFEASLPHYAAAVQLNPRAAEARLSYAMGLIRLRRYAEARAWLEDGIRAQPDRPELAHALARLLASAPDAAVRDGARALAMSKQLLQSHQNTDLGETMAMALAEVGSYGDAVNLQRDLLETTRTSGDAAAVRRIAANLRLYQSGRPSRVPWPDDDPAFATPLR
jgi:tetratricopeptide (TPR) repeat protein